MLDKQTCPVNSHNEWDPLEEVIIGTVDGAMFPAWNVINAATVPPGEWGRIEKEISGAGLPYPSEYVEAARRELAELIHILEAEGVKVRHVDPVDYQAPFVTPGWQVPSGFCAANPRDPFLVVGNEIIETPMPDRGRYFEAWAYRPLFKEYFKAGARWTAAPKPQLRDDLYDWNYTVPKDEHMRFVLNEFEPVFDAADFVRCGRDIFGQRSNATNALGIEWLRRHLGEKYRVHEIHNLSPEAIHIDTTFMPLAPGKVLVSPEYIDIDQLPPILKSWDILVAPEPKPFASPLGIVSKWISINVLMLDEKRVIVEKHQEPLIKALKGWGFEPIPCPFENYFPFLGAFHCATLDIRRRGELQSYF
uniref:Glycine amidinotransferase n=1 Tax=Candidatus Kentrum sp. FW TaxID=2126338 RepID=A0A450TDP6_9GAMM|nr:MAG: glycine amidinotransferase [Candidatus Kentron sp. FW]VFJ69558.1 MAG: glycine amidinotransferase [Candidatus Kentron sp. FW]